MCVVNATSSPLQPCKEPGTHCRGFWKGRIAALDVCKEIFFPPPGLNPELPCVCQVTTLTALSPPTTTFVLRHVQYNVPLILSPIWELFFRVKTEFRLLAL